MSGGSNHDFRGTQSIPFDTKSAIHILRKLDRPFANVGSEFTRAATLPYRPAGGHGQESTSEDLQGLKDLKVLQPLLESLHNSDRPCDKTGNRQLHMDCMMVLLWLYSPLLTSLRALQQASQLEKVRRKFKGPRAGLTE